jgi:hypothetical protein
VKSVLLKVAAAGAGAALMLCFLGAAVLWYISRPKPIRPWNDKALIANDMPGFGRDSDDSTFSFSYTVQNATGSDYALDSFQQPKLLAVIDDGSLSNPIDEKRLVLRTPIFIPSHQKGTITIRLKALKAPEQKQDEPDDTYHERLRQYLNDHIKSVEGFVLFDESNRYQVNLMRWAAKKPKVSEGQASSSRNP